MRRSRLKCLFCTAALNSKCYCAQFTMYFFSLCMNGMFDAVNLQCLYKSLSARLMHSSKEDVHENRHDDTDGQSGRDKEDKKNERRFVETCVAGSSIHGAARFIHTDDRMVVVFANFDCCSVIVAPENLFKISFHFYGP